MADFLIALGILVLLGVGVALAVRKSGSKWERRRAKAIADATVRRHEPLSDEEQELANAWHEDVQEARTGDLPKYRDERRPSVREVARRYRRPAKHSAKRLPRTRSSNPLTGPLPPQLEQTVMLPGKPPEWHVGSFTSGWTKEVVADILAKGKAGASR